MARMFPNYCFTDSPGERKLFNSLRDDEKTRDWVVLHSLHIARHISKAKGEADFVILIPKQGILIVEVKSHHEVKVKQGSWYFGRDSIPNESPFKQSETAMYSIRKHLIEVNPILSRVTFLNVVWFTEIEFPKDPHFEYQPWQVLNQKDITNSATSLLNSFEQGKRYLASKLGFSNSNVSHFNESTVELVLNALRPDFDIAMSEKVFRSNRRSELLKLAHEQFIALDIALDNRAALIKGAAGTGKSVLAVELAKRFQFNKRKVVLLCFNRLLREELNSQLEGSGVSVLTMDSHILKIARLSDPDLPRDNLEALRVIDPTKLQIPDAEKFEVLILDESQDLLNQSFVQVLNETLIGGLKNGNWFAFGDLDAQRIYGDTDVINFVRESIREVPIFTLTRNCRNVIQIGHFTEGLLPLKPKWETFLRNQSHPDPQLVTLNQDDDVTLYLDQAIAGFRGAGFSLGDIVVLSPIEINEPSFIFSESEFADKFVSGARSAGKISFVSISKFKGLESPCVVLLDLEQLISRPNQNDLLYVALTRATDRLSIIANHEAYEFMTGLIEKGA